MRYFIIIFSVLIITACYPPPEGKEVSLEGRMFVPNVLEVSVGDVVKWVHRQGMVPHTVTADMMLFDSREGEPDARMREGDTFKFKFDDVGEFVYYCVVHGDSGGVGMSGIINVSSSLKRK